MRTSSLLKSIVVITLMLWNGLGWGQIISQYIETNSGTIPKGLEIWNNTGAPLDFASSNLIVRQGTNGGALTDIGSTLVNSGTLAPNEVLVIGTSDIGTYLTTQGFTGVRFVEYGFAFNGDDALAIVYGGMVIDVFGNPGSDPGTAWSGNGVSTANQNIQLKSGVNVGDTDGWTDPSLRFETVSTNPVGDMSGFGLAPEGSGTPTSPTISTITQTPETGILTGEAVSVSATINPGDAAISLVDLKWGTSTGSYPNTINMSRVGESSTYTTDESIPAQEDGTTVYFVVYAEDVDSESATSSERSYAVQAPSVTPTAQPTGFAASALSSSSIAVSWVDADPAADGYLIKGSLVSYDDITSPADGVAEADGALVKNIAGGVETVNFTTLTAETKYYFRIFAYNGSGTNIKYKVDEVVQAEATTKKAPVATILLRPTHVDISTTTSESAVLVKLEGYDSDLVKYRIFGPSNQYDCWDSATETYISSFTYSDGPSAIGTPTSSTEFWIPYLRSNNNSTSGTYRDRLSPYSTNYQSASLPAATAITSSTTISNTDVNFAHSDFVAKHVVLAYDATTDGTIISATSTKLTSGEFSIVVPVGTTIRRIELRSVDNTLLESKTGTWPEEVPAVITLSETSLFDFGNVYTDHFSNVQFYTVDAEGLAADLVITPPAGFKASEVYNSNFQDNLSLTPVGGVISGKKIYVRFFPTSEGNVSGNITHASVGAETKNVAVAANGIAKNLGTYYSTITAAGGENLMAQLHKLINGHTVSTYDAIWNHFQSTDKKYNGKVWDIYSDRQDQMPAYEFTFVDDQDSGSEGTAEGQKYNREHSFPKSWWGGSETDTMHMDIFHIYPTDKYVNAQRGNWPFGIVSSPSTTFTNGSKLGYNSSGGTYASTAFEPIDEYKGDLARSYFYMATRYYWIIDEWGSYSDALNGTSYPAFEPWVVDMLLEWHQNDPVSQKEIDRNNAIAVIQGNRNPFIDNPEWVNAIWQNKEEPTNHITGLTSADISSVSVTITWSDAVGAIIPDGYLVMLKNATGEFPTPVDGTPIANDSDLADGLLISNVEHVGGANSVGFTGLEPNVEYTVVVYPYTNAGVNINYKTDGTIPQHQFTTLNYPYIVSISSVSPISVDYETLLADAIAALPAQTSITDSDDATHLVNLSWSIADYNGTSPGDYTATGTFTLPAGVIQSDPETELKVTTTVTVLERVVSFDIDANWIQDGSTSLSSYANHAYADHGVIVQGTNVLRNTTTAQDGFPGALGTHSVRIGNTAVSKVTITVAEGGVSDFSLMVRRWDGSPMPDYTVRYSYDGGIYWNALANIDGNLLETSDWFEYSGQVDKAHNNIQIEIANTGTTERIMIDNFKWNGYIDTEPPVVFVTPANNEVDVEVTINPIISFSEAIRNIDNSEITDENVVDLILFQTGGIDMPFTASINAAKTAITIVPTSALDYETEYSITVDPVEDQFNNATTELSSMFTTRVAPKFTVTYSVVEVDMETNGTLNAKVGETAIISGDEVIIGSSLEFTAAPNIGYQVKEWKVNSEIQSDETDNVFTVLDLQSDIVVTVEFTPVLVESISVSGDGSSSVVFGQTLQMLASITPVNALDKGVLWSITEGGTGTAIISETGLLTATGVGTVNVRATTKEAGSAIFGEATVTITKATASVTLSNLSQTYNATPRPVGITTEPAGLTVGVTYNGSTTVPITAGSYEVVVTVNEANYQGSVSGTLIIGKASLTIAAKDIVKIFGAVYEFVGDEYDVSGLLGSDRVTGVTLSSDGALAGTVVGDYDIVASDAQGDGLDNYVITYISGTMSVTDKTVLTISGVTAQSRVYNGTTAATITNYGSLNGVADGDDVSINSAGVIAAFSSKAVGEDKVVNVSGFALEGADANKYILGAINSVTASITPKSIEVVGAQAQSKVYDGTTTATIQGAELSGLMAGDLVEIDTQTANFDTKDVGNGIPVTATFTLKGDDAGNYSLDQPTGLVANITPVALTITADAKTKVYGDLDPTLTYQITTGAMVGDDQLSGSLNRTEGESANTYIINQGTLTAGGNYSIAFISANLTITPKQLSVAGAVAQSKVYDGTANAVIASASLLGVIAADNVQIDQAVGVFTSKDVGNDIAITSAITIKGDDVANYNLVQPTGLQADITPVALTIAVDAVSKVYGQADPALTYQISAGALVGDETLSGSLTRAPGEVVNTYAIAQGTLSASNNYDITFVSANFTITPKELTIGGSFTVSSKEFDGTTSATISSNTLSLIGIIGDDVVSLTNVVAAFVSSVIGDNIQVTIASAELAGADAFNYTLSLDGAPTTSASITEISYMVYFNVVEVDGLSNGILTAMVNGESLISGGEVVAGNDVLFSAVPDNGYQVKEWTLNGNVVSGNVANTYSVTNISQDITVTVKFEPIPPTMYSVQFSVVEVGGSSNGILTATADGSTILSGDEVEQGAEVVFTANPSVGYRVKAWFLNSQPVLGHTALTYSVSNLNDNIEVGVEFETESQTVTYPVLFSVVEVEGALNGTISASVNDEPIASGDFVEEGSSIVFTATPNEGYELDVWILNGDEDPSISMLEITYPDLAMAIDVHVRFKEIVIPSYTVTFSVVEVDAQANGAITASANGASIESGQTVAEGSTITFTATPDQGYRVMEWRLNGNVTGNTSNTYSISSITSDINVTVKFEPIPPTTFTVNFSVVEVGGATNGTLTASFASQSITSGTQVEEGSSINFTATPNQGYRVKEWTLNGVVIDGHKEQTYTLSNLAQSSTVTVEFEVITSAGTITLANLKAYPNPFTNFINIDGTMGITRVIISNVIGKRVMEITLNGESSINTSSLIDGIYLITFENSKGERVVRKMIKR